MGSREGILAECGVGWGRAAEGSRGGILEEKISACVYADGKNPIVRKRWMI